MNRNSMKSILRKGLSGEYTVTQVEEKLLELFFFSERTIEKDILPGSKRVIKLVFLDGEKCFYCNRTTIKHKKHFSKKRTIDHVIPKSKGGLDHIDNCVISCIKCNEEKGSEYIIPPSIKWRQRGRIRKGMWANKNESESLILESEYWINKKGWQA